MKIILILLILISLNDINCYNINLLPLKNKKIINTNINNILYNDKNMKIFELYYNYFEKKKIRNNLEIDFNEKEKENKNIIKINKVLNNTILTQLYNDEYIKEVCISYIKKTIIITYHNASIFEYIYNDNI